MKNTQKRENQFSLNTFLRTAALLVEFTKYKSSCISHEVTNFLCFVFVFVFSPLFLLQFAPSLIRFDKIFVIILIQQILGVINYVILGYMTLRHYGYIRYRQTVSISYATCASLLHFLYKFQFKELINKTDRRVFMIICFTWGKK